jgi:hypothetical protein
VLLLLPPPALLPAQSLALLPALLPALPAMPLPLTTRRISRSHPSESLGNMRLQEKPSDS